MSVQPIHTVVQAPHEEPQAIAARKGPLSQGLARLRKDRAAMLGLAFVVFIVLVAVLAPVITHFLGQSPYATPDDPTTLLTDTGLPKGSFGGVSPDHLFGVEPATGRDLFSRIVYGSRISLLVSIGATVMTMVLGVAFGSIAGFFPGRVDMVVSRVIDLFLAFPGLLFTIVLIGAVPDSFPKTLLLVLVLGGLGWSYIARLVRTLVLSMREREFVDAARTSGSGEWRILFREVMPNLTGPVITYTTLIIPGYVVAEAALSFLGVGVRVPTASWGDTLAQASSYYTVDPTYLAAPGLALFLTVFAFNLVGDGVSEAFNPKSLR